ncbi:formin-like protein 5 isoform X1 [Nematostella vectensis]|uniref:formin-like protein 5 isoform X1 n=1 Tax=Nematostella vectensis TaxID=45351 RepID=UPI00207726F3|nr:formin-like protein 5 isoform X1 [Nematostella vectensis]
MAASHGELQAAIYEYALFLIFSCWQSQDSIPMLSDVYLYLSGSLSRETLSPQAENERNQLCSRLKSLQEKQNNAAPLPPRPPKTVTQPPLLAEEEDFYDDTMAVEPPATSPSYYTMSVEGVPHETDDSEVKENYEVMAADNRLDNDNYEVALVEDETYDEPEKEKEETNETDVPQEAPAGKTASEPASDEIYEGVDGEETPPIKIEATNHHAKAFTHDLENLAKPLKVSDVPNVFLQGYLCKHRKKGIYIGSKWQKRYCVLRDYAMYYFKDNHAEKQKGTIILPGYTPVPANRSKKEFSLVRENDRIYTFLAESQEDAEMWMQGIKKCAGAMLSKRQSEILSDIRKKEHEGDEDSLTYDDLAEGATKSSDNEESFDGEMYDDVAAGTKLQEDKLEDYEVPDTNMSTKPPQVPLSDECYEAPVESEEAPPIQPPRPPKSEPIQGETYDLVQEPTPPVAPASQSEAALGDEFYDTAEEETVSPLEPVLKPPQQPIAPSRTLPTPERPPKPAAPAPVFDAGGDRLDEDMYDLVDAAKVPPSQTVPIQDSEYEVADTPPSRPDKPSNAPHIRTTPLPPPPEEPVPPRPSKPGAKPSPPLSTRPPPLGAKPTLPTPSEESKPSPPPPGEKKAPLPTPPSTPPAVTKAPVSTLVEEPAQVIDYASIYQAKWDVKADDEDELEFSRGDLIYIYEKANSDWWVGSKYKPQGYSIKLVPSNYIMRAYDLSTSLLGISPCLQ